MNKKLIAMAIAAAVAAPMAANAEGTVYGQLQAEISSSDTGAGSSIQMIDNARGRIGFKGSEELGNGMTMLGKMEFKVDTADGDSSGSIALTKREMMVGLKAGWGSFTMGRLKSPYKYSAGVNYDPFVTTTLQSRGVTTSGNAGQGNAQGHNGFMSDTVGISLMDGKFDLAIGVDENAGNQGDMTFSYTHAMGKKDEIVVAATAHSNDAAVAASGADYSAQKVGGSFGPVKFVVEATDANGTANTNLFVTYGMAMADGTLTIQGGTASGDSYNVDDLVDLTVGYTRKFTKAARWFAGFRSTTGGKTVADDQENTVVTYGMRFDY